MKKDTPRFFTALNYIYVIKSIIRRITPPRLFFILDFLKGDLNGAEVKVNDLYKYVEFIFDSVGINPQDKVIFEVGSGRYARLGLRLLNKGAKKIKAIDLYAVPLSNKKHRLILNQDIRDLSLSVDILSRLEVSTGDASLDDCLMDDAADIIFSISVLEHIRDPKALYHQCYKWLKPGGIMVHSIDFRDHENFQKPFQMLQFSDKTWRLFLNPPGGCHLNRWRIGEHITAIKEAGFVEVRKIPLTEDHLGLAKLRTHLNERFAKMSDDDLATLTGLVIAEKPL